MSSRLPVVIAVLAAGGAAWATAPADRVPAPEPEPCIPFEPELAEDDIAAPDGLGYEQVRGALNAVIQSALYCGQPEGFSEVHLTFELTVGCDGLVAAIEPSDTDGTPDTYVACVQSVIAKADFPAHDMADGMPVTYPVNVAW